MLVLQLKSLFCDSYHIAGTKGIFYAREPYSNVDAVHVTRFLGLASVGNKDKQVCFSHCNFWKHSLNFFL